MNRLDFILDESIKKDITLPMLSSYSNPIKSKSQLFIEKTIGKELEQIMKALYDEFSDIFISRLDELSMREIENRLYRIAEYRLERFEREFGLEQESGDIHIEPDPNRRVLLVELTVLFDTTKYEICRSFHYK